MIAATNGTSVKRDPPDAFVYSPPDGKTLDEVVEVIKLPCSAPRLA
jgi:hypothetical protein